MIARKFHDNILDNYTIKKYYKYRSILTQNQVLSAILLIYKAVLKQELYLQIDAVRAKRSRYVPIVLTREEVLAIINHLPEGHRLIMNLN
jgi:hypothetical protein